MSLDPPYKTIREILGPGLAIYSWSILPEDHTFHTVTACCHNFQLITLLLTMHDHNLHKFAHYNKVAHPSI